MNGDWAAKAQMVKGGCTTFNYCEAAIPKDESTGSCWNFGCTPKADDTTTLSLGRAQQRCSKTRSHQQNLVFLNGRIGLI